MFEDELTEARKNYTDACNHHAQMADLHRDGVISDEELMETIEDIYDKKKQVMIEDTAHYLEETEGIDVL